MPESKPRRAKGEGSWHTRPDGRMQYRFTLEGKRHTVYGSSRNECLAKAKELRKAVEQGALSADPKVTVEAWFTEWLKDVQRHQRRNTYILYEYAVRRHIVPALGSYKLLRLRPHHIRAWRRTLDASQFAPATVQVAHAVLSAGLQQAYEDTLIGFNPARRVPNSGSEETDVEPFTAEQVARFLAAAEGTRDVVMYHVALTMCLRQGEILGLRWADLEIDKSPPTMAIRHQLQHGEIVPLKRRRDQVLWTLPPRLVPLLRQQAAMLQRERAQRTSGKPYRVMGLVFPSPDGSPQNKGTVLRRFVRTVERAGFFAELPDSPHFHALRHTGATMRLMAGQPLWEVSRLLGHASVRTTERVYAHYMPEQGKVFDPFAQSGQGG